MKPIKNNVIIKAFDKETSGGIMMPSDTKFKPSIGKVVETGPGTDESPVNLSPGDKVYYDPGTEDDLENGLFRINYNNIIAIL